MSNMLPCKVEKDKLNMTTFDKVTISALHLEAQLQADYSAGILEWQVK